MKGTLVKMVHVFIRFSRLVFSPALESRGEKITIRVLLSCYISTINRYCLIFTTMTHLFSDFKSVSIAEKLAYAKMNSVLNVREVSQIVKNNLRGNDLEIAGFSLEELDSDSIGFLGEHARLTAKLIKGKENLEKTYFVKKVPEKISAQGEYVRRLRCFNKEIGIYDTVFPALEKIAFRVPKWHPDFYFSRGEEIMVLEDLIQSGYYMYPERTLMDEEHILRSLEALASMHACSMIYEEKLKEGGGKNTLAEMFPRYVLESYDSEEEHTYNTVLEAAIKAQLKIVDLLEGYTSAQHKLIEKELPFRMRKMPTLRQPSRKFRNVLIHGDFWANNVLFAKEENGIVKNAKIVDFQLVRYAPPVQDILIFLFTVQDQNFREKNCQKLLRHYHDALSSCLVKHGLKVDDFVTWYELLGTYDYYEELGLLTAIYFFQLVLTPPELCKKFLGTSETYRHFALVDRSELVTTCFLNNSLYRKRVTEAMNILIKEYIL